jgi:hypothetical protein
MRAPRRSRRTVRGQRGQTSLRRTPSRRTSTGRSSLIRRGTKNVTGGRASVTAKRDPELERKLKKTLEDERKKLTKAPPRPTPSDKGKVGFRRNPLTRRR